jgi:transposase
VRPFRPPPWDDQHPEFRRIDATLPALHHARWLATVVTHLDLNPLTRSYANRGSQAYLPQLLLAFVLFMYSKSILSPARWAEASRYDDQAKWLLQGFQPSRTLLYTFRNRLEPYLNDWHAQVIAWAIFEKLTSAERGSLDGTLIAALASRHRLLGARRLDQRLLLLRLLVWCDRHQLTCDLATFLDDFAAWLLLSVEGRALPSGTPASPGDAALETLVALLDPVLQGQVVLPGRLPTWVPVSVAGRQRVLERYVKAQERLTQRLEPYQQKKRLTRKDKEAIKRMKVSPTDPEAALGWDKLGTYRTLYNLVLVQATDLPLTLAWDVLSCNNDQGLMETMMEETRKRVGHHLKELLVDGGFLNVTDVVWCEAAGIAIYAPPAKLDAAQVAAAQAAAAQAAAARVAAARAAAAQLAAAQAAAAKAAQVPVATAPVATAPVATAPVATAPAERPKGKQAGEARGKKEEKSGGKKEEKLPKSAFRYEQKEDVYYCPQGKRLQPVLRKTEKRKSGVELPVVVYGASRQDCQACLERAGCTSNARGRTVKRYEGEESLERLEQRMQEPAAQQVYKLRCQSVELANADLKEHRGLRVFRCFGKQRVRAQAGLTILASNGLVIMRALHRRSLSLDSLSPQEKRPA